MGNAEALARARFGTIKDRGGDLMINHMARVVDMLDDPVDKEVGWLHDIVEDTHTTLDELRELGFPEVVVAAVDLLTHRKKEMKYAEYINRICASGNLHAIRVKLADQFDNTDPHRMMLLDKFVRAALQKRYRGVKEKLIEAANAPRPGV